MQVDVNLSDLLSPQFEPLVIRRVEHVVEDAIIKTLKENFVTKLELQESNNEVVLAMREMENRITKSISDLDVKLSKNISDLDVKLSKNISDLDVKLSDKISSMEVRLLYKIIGFNFAFVMAGLAIAKFIF